MNYVRNIKLFIGYILYILFLGFITFYNESYTELLKRNVLNNDTIWIYASYIGIVPIIIGIVFAVPYLIKSKREKGAWYFDWVKFISIGLPTFFWDIYPAIFWTPANVYLPKIHWFMPYPLAGIVFGYILVTSFNRENFIL